LQTIVGVNIKIISSRLIITLCDIKPPLTEIHHPEEVHMGCCVGEKLSNWCEEYGIVYIDAAGKEYCIFHAPADCKLTELYDERKGGDKPDLMEAEQFNGLVFARIDGVIEAGVDEKRDEWDHTQLLFKTWSPRCDFSYAILPFAITFSKYNNRDKNQLPPINFIGSQFWSNAKFKKSQFCGDADFSNSHFSEVTDFDNTQFNGNSYFYDSQFSKDTSFISSKFNGHVVFYSSQFKGYTYFTSSQFSGDADFTRSQFNAKAYFSRSHFNGKADFSESLLKEDADFSDVKIQKQAIFTDVKFIKSNFDQMEFNGPVYFDNTIFENEASFKNTIFHDYSHFE